MSSCEHVNELFGSIKSGGISGAAEQLLPSKEGLCSVE
jgi:hypothetical protein